MFIFLISLIATASPLNVLILHPIYSGSHVLILQSLASNLLSQGDSVTTIRYKDNHNLHLPSHHNHTQMLRALDNSKGKYPYLTIEERAVFELPQELLWSKGLNMFVILKAMDAWKVMDGFCEDILGDKTLYENLQEEQFDVVVVDLIYNECSLALARKLSVPVVGYWAFSFASGPQEFTTAPAPPYYVPGFMSKVSDQMDFWDRSHNLMLNIFGKVLMNFHDWYVSGLIAKYMETPKKGSEILNDISGLLINTDFVLDFPRPMPPSFINIGGLQINPSQKKLPFYMKSFLDGADEGAILFSMGFIFNPTIVPHERVEAFLSAFKKLPQRVVFKYDLNYNLSLKVPDNVMMVPWVPQQAVLAHHNLNLFLTHCGMHRVLEAIYYGVPMVGMPVFIDQGDVMVRIEEKGIGIGIDKFADTDEIVEAIKKVDGDPKYKMNIDQLSATMKDRQNTPMEDAMWLLNHVSKTKGAEHLKIKSGRLSFIQYFCLDCIVLFFSVSLIILWGLYKIGSTVIKLKSPKKRSKQPMATNGNYHHQKKIN